MQMQVQMQMRVRVRVRVQMQMQVQTRAGKRRQTRPGSCLRLRPLQHDVCLMTAAQRWSRGLQGPSTESSSWMARQVA